MNIYLNGARYPLAVALSVQSVLEQLDYVGKRVAVEVNGEIIPRTQLDQTLLREGDRVEIIQAVGGG